MALTPMANAYYLSGGRLYDDNHRDQYIDNIKAIDLEFRQDNRGFILFNDGVLKIVEKQQYGLKVDSIYLDRYVTQISYPYYLSGENLNYYSHDLNRSIYMVGYIEKLCFDYAVEKPFGNLEKRTYKLAGSRFEEAIGELPHYCQ
jgi:hypothetical protein